MSLQPTFAHFGLKKRVEHRGQQNEVAIPAFAKSTTKNFKCDACDETFGNKQGLIVHQKMQARKLVRRKHHNMQRTTFKRTQR